MLRLYISSTDLDSTFERKKKSFFLSTDWKVPAFSLSSVDLSITHLSFPRQLAFIRPTSRPHESQNKENCLLSFSPFYSIFENSNDLDQSYRRRSNRHLNGIKYSALGDWKGLLYVQKPLCITSKRMLETCGTLSVDDVIIGCLETNKATKTIDAWYLLSSFCFTWQMCVTLMMWRNLGM